MEKVGRFHGAETKISAQKQESLEPLFDKHKFEVVKLALLAGVELSQGTPLIDIVDKTQSWAKGDHYEPKESLDFTADDKAVALSLFKVLGLIEEISPEGGVYDQILILGGEQSTNHIRLDYAFKQLAAGSVKIAGDGALVCLGGDRQLKGRELPAVSEDVSKLIQLGMADPWALKLLNSPMLAALHEESAMRLAVLARLGSLDISEIHLRLNSADIVSHRLFEGNEIIPRVATVFAPKVERALGQPRHTTESTLLEWAHTMGPKEGSRVLFVSNAPYAIRTARNLMNTIKPLRPDILFDYCAAPASYDDSLVRRSYGELARLLYEDLKATK